MSRLFKTTLRVRLDTPEGRKAWGYLVSRDKSKYRSYSDATGISKLATGFPI